MMVSQGRQMARHVIDLVMLAWLAGQTEPNVCSLHLGASRFNPNYIRQQVQGTRIHLFPKVSK